MNSSLIKTLFICLLYLAMPIESAFSQVRSDETTGMTYTRSINFGLEIQRISDNKKTELSEGFNGAAFIYEKRYSKNVEWAFYYGLMNRYSSVKLFDSDIRNTDISEEIFWAQLGLNLLMRKAWVFYPYAAANISYYSVSAKINNALTNSPTLETATPADTYIDESISTSITYLSFTFGLNYDFRYSGMKFFIQNFPHAFNVGGKINDNYNFKYKLSGYLIGIGFVAYL